MIKQISDRWLMLSLVFVTMWSAGLALARQAPAGSAAPTQKTVQSNAQDNSWMNAPPASTGVAVGQKIPAFNLSDQAGKPQTFDSIKGPKGAVIYFNRSVDW